MKKYTRFFIYFSGLFCLIMGSLMVFQYIREKDYRSRQLDSQLMLYNEMIYRYLDSNQVDWSQVNQFVSCLPDSNLRVTVIDTLGNVCFDSSNSDDSHFENHLLRPEIVALKHAKMGKVIRKSTSLGTEFYYVAERFPGYYVRSSLPYNVSLSASLKANYVFIYVMSALLLVVMVLFYIVTRNFSTQVQKNENQLKRELTQNISHELKTPVSSILGYMESLLDNPDLPMDRRQFFVERTHHQAKRLSALLQDISTLNKLDESKDLYDREACNVTAIVEEVLNDLHDGVVAKRCSVVNLLPPDVMVKGNKTLIYSIFHNLVDNALNYAGENIVITIDVVSKIGGYYGFQFSDNGVGIPSEHIPRIFERFYRVDKGRSRRLGGTGLGLSIVKNAVLFHHGSISVQNVASGGAQFTFTLRKY